MEKLKVPFVPNFMLGVAGGLQYLSFKKAAKSPRKYQEKTLRGILEFAKTPFMARNTISQRFCKQRMTPSCINAIRKMYNPMIMRIFVLL